MTEPSIPLSPIFLQMLMKLGESTAVTVAGLYCMKLIRVVKNRVSASAEKTLPSTAKEITLLLSGKQRKLINEVISDDSPRLLPPGGEREADLDSQSKQVAIILTKKQRKQIKDATGQDPTELKVTAVVGRADQHEWIKAVFDRSTWAARLHGDPAMTAWEFFEQWSSILLLVVYLCLKMYLNIRKWTS